MFSKLIRRTHMYLALFLIPWMVMYALSSLAMNHHLNEPPVWEKASERSYKATFAEGTDPKVTARQILRDLKMDGRHRVRQADDGKSLTIVRESMPAQKRVTYTPGDGKLVIEREVVKTTSLLRRLHVRKGYQDEYAADDAWAFAVDLIIVAMVFWVLSGLWMWWGMKATRRWGALAAVGGAGLFLIFVAIL